MMSVCYYDDKKKFCPKTKSHDKIRLAEDTFKFTRRLRLKEYFASKLTDENPEDSEDNTAETHHDLPFFNKTQSSFTPYAGRDSYLDFYITAITEKILQNCNDKKRYSNISKTELDSLINVISR